MIAAAMSLKTLAPGGASMSGLSEPRCKETTPLATSREATVFQRVSMRKNRFLAVLRSPQAHVRCCDLEYMASKGRYPTPLDIVSKVKARAPCR
jgi:hypothetical protein